MIIKGLQAVLPAPETFRLPTSPKKRIQAKSSHQSTVCRCHHHIKHSERWRSQGIALFASFLLFWAPAVEAAPILYGTPRVIDGDTLTINNKERVRLFGIDAPESKQSCSLADNSCYPCGTLSKQQLEQKINGNKIACTVKNKDIYGRSVSICMLNGLDLNQWMVQNGLAIAYRRYSKQYVADEIAAQEAKRGIWAGEFEIPEDWRRENGNVGGSAPVPCSPLSSPSPSPSPISVVAPPPPYPRPSPLPVDKNCLIKGNIGAKGEKIYHVPGGRFYNSVKIDESAGERWFCSEKEALAAGWRPSKS